MSDVPYLDFRYGMVSERLRRRSDLSMYSNSAEKIENMVPLRTGGLKQREGLKYKCLCSHTIARAIPLSVSDDKNFLVCFTSDKHIIIYDTSNYTYNDIGIHNLDGNQLRKMNYAQTYNKMVFASEGVKPHTLDWIVNSNGSVSFSFNEFVLKYQRSVYVDGTKRDDLYAHVSNYTYEDFLDNGNYPSGVAFVANRLAFYNFKNQPYGLFMSKPFEYDDFQENVVYLNEGTNLTKNLYLKALELQGSTISEKGTQVGSDGTEYQDSYLKTVTSVSTSGYYITIKTIVDDNAVEKETWIETKVYSFEETSAGSDVWTMTDTGEVQNSAVYFSSQVWLQSEHVTDDCAIRLELASVRNETICWMGQIGEYVYMGTKSSEWVIPYDMTANNVQAKMMSSYGSDINHRCEYGMRDIFYVQTGNRKIRTLSSEGNQFIELTYQCSAMFEGGIGEMAWQKVPEPRLYVIDGEDNHILHVLCYDVDYGVSGWCNWIFEKPISDIVTFQSDKGQSVAVISDGNIIGEFDDTQYFDSYSSDGEKSLFIPKFITNLIDSSSSLSYSKRNYKVYADTMGSEFKVYALSGGREGTPMRCRNVKPMLTDINTYSVDYNGQGLRIGMEGMPEHEFVVLALVVDLEVVK